MTETNLKGGSCVLSVGNFDGVHSGHKELISKLKELSLRHSVPAVAWTFAEHPNNYFKAGSLRYITSLEERESLLLDAGADTVFHADFPEYKNMSAEDFVEKELCGRGGAIAVVCGHSFTFGANAEGTPEKLKKLLNERG